VTEVFAIQLFPAGKQLNKPLNSSAFKIEYYVLWQGVIIFTLCNEPKKI
jgi:hypothetical protein